MDRVTQNWSTSHKRIEERKRCWVDSKVQAYVSKVREGGVAVNAKIEVAGAKGILLSSSHSFLAEYRDSISLTRTWAHVLLR